MSATSSSAAWRIATTCSPIVSARFLQIIAEGRSNKEVANLLNISLTTVETHRAHILQKLDIHSIPELILYAVRKGIVS